MSSEGFVTKIAEGTTMMPQLRVGWWNAESYAQPVNILRHLIVMDNYTNSGDAG
jgi:hypothetical protein